MYSVEKKSADDILLKCQNLFYGKKIRKLSSNCHPICWISPESGKGFFIFILFSYLFFLLFFFFYIILDVYNGLNLPFQLVGYSHLFC